MNVNCRRMSPYLSAAADEIDRATARALDQHLETCVRCRAEAAHFERIRGTIAVIGRTEGEPPADLVPAILARAAKERRHTIPMLPIPTVELARVIQENRDVIAGAAGVAIVAAGAAWALWRAVRGSGRTAPARG